MLRIQRELIRCAPSLAQMLRSQETAPCTPPLERVHCRSWYDALHHGARAAITAGADVMNSSLAHVLRTLQDLIRCAQPRRICCDHCRSWCDERQHGARAAITAGAVAMCSTTGAGAAVTARAGATYFTSNAGTANNAVSSRVPSPTVDRRVSVNSEAERRGATKLCLHKHVMKRTR